MDVGLEGMLELVRVKYWILKIRNVMISFFVRQIKYIINGMVVFFYRRFGQNCYRWLKP